MKNVEEVVLSPFWRSHNFRNGEAVYIRRLGPFYDGQEFRGIVRGVYNCDINGNPDAYIIELLDNIPVNPEYENPQSDSYINSFSHHVFTRACVDSINDFDARNVYGTLIEGNV